MPPREYLKGRIATGARAGRRVRTIGGGLDLEDGTTPDGPRCATASGVSVHANVSIAARNRRRLELLCRYVARPALATERLSLLPDGRVMYELKHRSRDGTTHVVFEPLELLEKLASLVPPPRFNLVITGCLPLRPAGDRMWYLPTPPSKRRCDPAARVAGARNPSPLALGTTRGLN
jgi:hypothetical protein